MNAPMTEERLAEIEADTRNHGICCMDCSVETILELTAEVRRLRECIANAPHNDMCSFDKYANPLHEVTTCDCGVGDWQREALGGGE